MYHVRIVPPSYPRPSDCHRGPFRFPPVAVGKPTRRYLILCFFQCSKLFFSSERSYYARIVPTSYPRPSDCPRGPFRFPPVAVGKPTRRYLILCFFQCSKLFFSSERSYYARIVPTSYPRPSDCPRGPFRFPPVAVGKPTTLS